MDYLKFMSLNFCPDCGEARGICKCETVDLEGRYQTFIKSRPLAWWRGYMREAYTTYAKLVDRPLTMADKRRLWKRLKSNHREGAIGSAVGLANVANIFAKDGE